MVTKTHTIQKWSSIFKYFIIEEIRFHSNLFGLHRLLLFPAFIFILISSAIGSAMYFNIGTVEQILLASHGIAFIVAFQIGSVAFFADDAASDLLGDRSTLLYGYTYLPITRGTVLGIFAIKDILFYVTLFVLPAIASASIFLSLPLQNTLLLLLSLGIIFFGGIVTSLAIAVTSIANKYASIFLAIFLAVGETLFLSYTRYTITDQIVYTASSTTNRHTLIILSILYIALFGIYTVLIMQNTTQNSKTPAYQNILHTILQSKYQSPKYAITTRTLTDVLRSSGGIFKIGFTVSILIALSAYILRILEVSVTIYPNYTIVITAILSLASYAFYVWLFQNDTLNEYLALPATEHTVYEAKKSAYNIITLTTLIISIALTTIAFNTNLLISIGTLVLAVTLTRLYYNITYILAQFNPMDFLFDTQRFGIFCGSLMILYLPILILGLFGTAVLTITQIFGVLLSLAFVVFLINTVLTKIANVTV